MTLLDVTHSTINIQRTNMHPENSRQHRLLALKLFHGFVLLQEITHLNAAKS